MRRKTKEAKDNIEIVELALTPVVGSILGATNPIVLGAVQAVSDLCDSVFGA